MTQVRIAVSVEGTEGELIPARGRYDRVTFTPSRRRVTTGDAPEIVLPSEVAVDLAAANPVTVDLSPSDGTTWYWSVTETVGRAVGEQTATYAITIPGSADVLELAEIAHINTETFEPIADHPTIAEELDALDAAKANVSHTHSIDGIDGLQGALDAKATAAALADAVDDLAAEVSAREGLGASLPQKYVSKEFAQLPDQTWFTRARRGFFAHYVWGGMASPNFTVDRSGSVPGSLDDLAESFDTEAFASDMAAFGVEYVVFTAFHYAMHALYPSEVLNAALPGHATTSFDLVEAVVTALAARGIKTVLYVHPVGGADLTSAEQAATGWNEGGSYTTWQNFINDLFTEIGMRYAGKIAGFWVDMIQSPDFTTRFTDLPRLRRSLLAGDASRVLIGNQGTSDGFVTDFAPTKVVDFRTREYISPPTPNSWTASHNSVAAIASTTDWFARAAQGSGNRLKFSAQDMSRLTVFNAGSSRYGGGLMWAAGPYAGTDASSMWEDGVREGMVALDAYIAPIAKALTNVVAEPGYEVAAGATLTSLGSPGYVVTRSIDGEETYVSVLNPPPSGKTVTIGQPAGRVKFTSGYNLVTGRAVQVLLTSAGYTLTMNESDDWSDVATVLVLRREESFGETMFVPARDFTNQGGGAVFSGTAMAGRWAAWNLTYDASKQVEVNFAVPDGWRRCRLELLIMKNGGTDNAVMTITAAQIVPGGTGSTDESSYSGTISLLPNGMLAAVSPLPLLTIKAGAIQHVRVARTGNLIGAANTYVVGLRLIRVE